MYIFKKRLAASVIGAVFALTMVVTPAAGALTIGGPSDCDDNAIIRCGAHSTGEIVNKYNSSAYVKNAYAIFGISNVDISSLPSTNVPGRVTKDGKVFVDGQSGAVATGAVTGGRQNMPGSSRVVYHGALVFTRPPSVSFQQASRPAFVSMKNGKFQFAVIASCGNAVRATATASAPQKAAVAPAKAVETPKPQPKPKPAPKPAPAAAAPAQVQAQAQQQEVNVTQNQEVTVNNTTPATPAPAPEKEEVAAAQPVQETEEAPATLPNTGSNSGAAIGIFSISTVLGAVGFRRYLVHILGS